MRGNLKSLVALILVLSLSIFNLQVSAAASDFYKELDIVSGYAPELALRMNEKDFTFNSNSDQYVRLSMDASTLIKNYPGSIRINAYELAGEYKSLISAVTLTATSSRRAKSLKASLMIGNLVDESKTIFFDVFDADGFLVNTYEADIAVAAGADQKLRSVFAAAGASETTNSKIGDEELQYIVNNLDFRMVRTANKGVSVERKMEGGFVVNIPMFNTSPSRLYAKLKQTRKRLLAKRNARRAKRGLKRTKRPALARTTVAKAVVEKTLNLTVEQSAVASGAIRGRIANDTIHVIRFSPNSSATWTLAVPKDLLKNKPNHGTVKVKLHWSPSDASGQQVNWQFGYSSIADGDGLNEMQFNNVDKLVTAPTKELGMVSTEFEIPVANLKDTLFVKVKRLDNNGFYPYLSNIEMNYPVMGFGKGK